MQPTLVETARIQVAGVLLGDAWVQLGMMYGYPVGASHAAPKYNTDLLLEQLVDRIACQTVGPRAIGGDFNFDSHELTQLRRLHDMGFREVQDLACHMGQHEVQATGKGRRRIDHLWISAERQMCFKQVEVRRDLWADHAAVIATFHKDQLQAPIEHWRMPMALPWPDHWTCQVEFDRSCDPTKAYAKMWFELEHQAVLHNQANQAPIATPQQRGRGTTLQTTCKTRRVPPGKLGRYGEVQPKFHGLSLQHNRWFKQLRRIQALKQVLQSSRTQTTDLSRAALGETWRSIRRAPGFPGGFVKWWEVQQLKPELPPGEVLHCPSADTVQAMFQTFHQVVKDFEVRLASQRRTQAKQRRTHELRYVFSDCKGEAPASVETMIGFVQAEVEEVRAEEQAVVLTAAASFDEALPVVAQGSHRSVVHQDSDMLWLDSVDSIEPGTVITQERLVATDSELMEALENTWRPRWAKMSHVVEGQWAQILRFAKQVLKPVAWNFDDWTSDKVQAMFRQKKARAAKGLDGVSRSDCLALPPQGCNAISGIYATIEQTHEWPQQLQTGEVRSLAKTVHQGMADHFRPITVYPLLYRVWSSCRARQALQSISSTLPSAVKGGVPGRHSKGIWHTLALHLDFANASNLPLHGLILDIRKAFNALPRLPLWSTLLHLGFPRPLLCTWVAIISKQTRRFRVRQSLGKPLYSCSGFPEGCGLSVFAMVLVDWLLDLWLSNVHGQFRLKTFVDDWQVQFHTAELMIPLWTAIQDFASMIDVDIDLGKTHAWSLEASARAQYRQGPVPVKLGARSLGAHQNFCRRFSNSTLLQRIRGMTKTWSALRACLSPYKLKAMALKILAWPRALHGVSVVAVGDQHFRDLRSGAMKGLRSNRIGANPMLHLCTQSLVSDPEVWSILQTIKDAREYPDRHLLEAFLGLFASAPAEMPRNGPVAALRGRLVRLGWEVHPNGIVSDRYGAFSILHAPWQEIVARLSVAWSGVLAQAVSHRPTFKGLDAADIQEVQDKVKTYGEADQAFIRCMLDGTLFTQRARAHFQAEIKGECVFCQQPDGFEHRMWNCPHFRDCRTHLTEQDHDTIAELPVCTRLHGWPLIPASVHRFIIISFTCPSSR